MLPLTQPQTPSQWNYFVARLQDIINSIRDASNRQPVNVVPSDYAVYNGSALPALSINGASAALDTTKHQFGAASLKLTATAATVTVEFSADPILLPPNSEWIESVYIQSSRTAIAGTLALDTPGGSHPVDISGNLLPGTWGRLYGDCDLRADPSTTATLALTLTGCSAGDTFNLEGWQIEHATGSTNLPSPFVNTTVPQGYVDTADNAVEALTNANNAQTAANQANAQLAAIASDGTLSPPEKPVVIRDYTVVTNEQAGIDAQALAYLGAASAQQVAYDNAITALTNYLATLTAPTAWNDKSGNTAVVAATFDATWNTVYENRQVLLNAIYQKAQSLANTAQSTANTGVTNAATAQTTANTAQTTGTNAQNTANTANTTANTANANTPNVINPQFADGANGWTMQQGWIEFDGHAQYTGYAGAVNNAIYNTRLVPVTLGQQVTVQATLHGFSGAGTCGACVAWFDSNSNWLAFSSRGATVTGTTGSVVSRVTAAAPATAAYAAAAADVWSGTSGGFTADDFILTPSLSSVDELPDGTGRFAVVNGGGLNAVSAVDPNKKALIDFTQTGHTGKTLANIPDDPPSTRFAVSNIDGNRRALIDATQAGHVGAWNLDSRVADGTNFQRVGTGYADTSGRIINLWDGTAVRSAVNTWDGANRARTGLDSSGILVPNLHPVDNLKDGTYARMKASSMTGNDFDFAKGGVNRNMGYVPDGGGRYGVHAVDSNNLAIIDFSQAGHVNKNLDNIGNGTTYARPLATQLQNGVLRAINSGRNLIGNGGFELNVSNSTCGDGWDGGGGLFGVARANAGAGAAHSGAYVLQINAAPGTVIPTGNTFAGTNHNGVDCNAGDTLYLCAWFKNLGSPSSFPAGITGNLAAQIVFLDASNNVISSLAVSANLTASGWQQVTNTGVAPAGTVSAYAEVLAYTSNTTGSAWTVPAGTYPFFAYIDDLFCYAVSNLDTDVQDGTVHGRTLQTYLSNNRPVFDLDDTFHRNKSQDYLPAGATYGQTALADLYSSGGVSRVGLRVPGSGHQLGDQFNSPPIASANLRSTWTGQTISYSATAGSPATATISVTAATLLAGAASKAYNAMSVGVSGTGGSTVTYYLYFDDPTYAGGAQTLVATTTGSNIYGANGRVYVGSIPVTFPTSGSGSGAGSGGGGACVALGAYGPRGRFDRETRCVDTPDGAVSVRNLKTSHQKCVRVEYDNGTVLTCSEDAPLMDGQRKVPAIDALGEILDTSEGPSRVRGVESAGILEVVSIDAGDVAYYASDNPDGPFALHHNKIIP